MRTLTISIISCIYIILVELSLEDCYFAIVFFCFVFLGSHVIFMSASY